MSASPFYSSVGEVSLPKMDEETKDAMKARAVVNAVFTKEEKDKAVKRHFENTFDYPLFTESDMSEMAEIDYLKGRSERSEDLQDLDKMEEGIRMANRGKEIKRMSPQQRELEVADELLNLKEAVPGLEKDIGDRSTPIPEIDENMFNITEKAILDDMGARRGGGPTDRTLVVIQKEMKKNQAQKFYELLSTYITYKDADKAFQEYLKETKQQEFFDKKLRMEMFNNIERGIANEFDFDSHIVKFKGGKRTRRRKQTKRKRHLKKSTKSRKTKRRKRRTLKK